MLAGVAVATGVPIMTFAHHGTQTWGELSEVPLMSAVFLAMAWHARRRLETMRLVEAQARQQASLLERQERFLHDASHELRTPVTIARGHLEVLRRLDGEAAGVDVVLDELARIERILERLLLLAKADQPNFVVETEMELDTFLEDMFLRWSEVAPRVWRLGERTGAILRADSDGLRIALDSLLENAVNYTVPGDAIELRVLWRAGDVVIEIEDEGCGVPPEALDLIFERFSRADPARTRAKGGVGLGLAIVDAIMKAHGGQCEVATSDGGSTFGLRFPSARVTCETPAAHVAAPLGVEPGRVDAVATTPPGATHVDRTGRDRPPPRRSAESTPAGHSSQGAEI